MHFPGTLRGMKAKIEIYIYIGTKHLFSRLRVDLFMQLFNSFNMQKYAE